MAISSFFQYLLTFLSAMAILTLLIGVVGYYTQPEGPGEILLPSNTIMLLHDNFQYVVALSVIVVLGEWTYKRPRKRKYEGDEYVTSRDEDEGSPGRQF